jgi:hypothetical protein
MASPSIYGLARSIIPDISHLHNAERFDILDVVPVHEEDAVLLIPAGGRFTVFSYFRTIIPDFNSGHCNSGISGLGMA